MPGVKNTRSQRARKALQTNLKNETTTEQDKEGSKQNTLNFKVEIKPKGEERKADDSITKVELINFSNKNGGHPLEAAQDGQEDQQVQQRFEEAKEQGEGQQNEKQEDSLGKAKDQQHQINVDNANPRESKRSRRKKPEKIDAKLSSVKKAESGMKSKQSLVREAKREESDNNGLDRKSRKTGREAKRNKIDQKQDLQEIAELNETQQTLSKDQTSAKPNDFIITPKKSAKDLNSGQRKLEVSEASAGGQSLSTIRAKVQDGRSSQGKLSANEHRQGNQDSFIPERSSAQPQPESDPASPAIEVDPFSAPSVSMTPQQEHIPPTSRDHILGMSEGSPESLAGEARPADPLVFQSPSFQALDLGELEPNSHNQLVALKQKRHADKSNMCLALRSNGQEQNDARYEVPVAQNYYKQGIRVPLPVADVDQGTIEFLEEKAKFYQKQIDFMLMAQDDQKEATQLARKLGLTAILKLVLYPRILNIFTNLDKSYATKQASIYQEAIKSLHDRVVKEQKSAGDDTDAQSEIGADIIAHLQRHLLSNDKLIEGSSLTRLELLEQMKNTLSRDILQLNVKLLQQQANENQINSSSDPDLITLNEEDVEDLISIYTLDEVLTLSASKKPEKKAQGQNLSLFNEILEHARSEYPNLQLSQPQQRWTTISKPTCQFLQISEAQAVKLAGLIDLFHERIQVLGILIHMITEDSEPMTMKRVDEIERVERDVLKQITQQQLDGMREARALGLELKRRKYSQIDQNQEGQKEPKSKKAGNHNLLADLQKKIDARTLVSTKNSDDEEVDPESLQPGNGAAIATQPPSLPTQHQINAFFNINQSEEPKPMRGLLVAPNNNKQDRNQEVSDLKSKLVKHSLQAKLDSLENEAKLNCQKSNNCDWAACDTAALVRWLEQNKEEDFRAVAALYGSHPDRFDNKRKNIQLHDSFLAYQDARWKQLKKTKFSHMADQAGGQSPRVLLTPRNPFKRDEQVIEYDQDSEDEWNDMIGENVSDNENEDCLDFDENDPSLIEEGFIVEDDYFSDTSYEYEEQSDGEAVLKTLSKRKRELLIRQENFRRLKDNRTAMTERNRAVVIEIMDGQSHSTEASEQYKAVSLMTMPAQTQNINDVQPAKLDWEFPLSVIKQKDPASSSATKCPTVYETLESNLLEIAPIVHGSRLGKVDCKQVIGDKFPKVKRQEISLFFSKCVNKERISNGDRKSIRRSKGLGSSKAQKEMKQQQISQDQDSEIIAGPIKDGGEQSSNEPQSSTTRRLLTINADELFDTFSTYEENSDVRMLNRLTKADLQEYLERIFQENVQKDIEESQSSQQEAQQQGEDSVPNFGGNIKQSPAKQASVTELQEAASPEPELRDQVGQDFNPPPTVNQISKKNDQNRQRKRSSAFAVAEQPEHQQLNSSSKHAIPADNFSFANSGRHDNHNREQTPALQAQALEPTSFVNFSASNPVPDQDARGTPALDPPQDGKQGKRFGLLDNSAVKKAISEYSKASKRGEAASKGRQDLVVDLQLHDQSMEQLYTRQNQQEKSTPIMDFKSLNKAGIRKKAETKPRQQKELFNASNASQSDSQQMNSQAMATEMVLPMRNIRRSSTNRPNSKVPKKSGNRKRITQCIAEEGMLDYEIDQREKGVAEMPEDDELNNC